MCGLIGQNYTLESFILNDPNYIKATPFIKICFFFRAVRFQQGVIQRNSMMVQTVQIPPNEGERAKMGI